MNCYDDRLRELLEQVNRKEQLEAKLRSMYDMRSALTKRLKNWTKSVKRSRTTLTVWKTAASQAFFTALSGVRSKSWIRKGKKPTTQS